MLRELLSMSSPARFFRWAPGRWLYLFLAVFVSAGTQHSAAQEVEALSPLDSAFFRVQSFNTSAGDRPTAINHLGIETERAADGGHLITAALEGYPAHAAGLERGDVILRINGAEFHPILSLNPRAEEGEFNPLKDSIEITYMRGAAILTVLVAPVFESLLSQRHTQ
jgi:S1-C subfamily serine protease